MCACACVCVCVCVRVCVHVCVKYFNTLNLYSVFLYGVFMLGVPCNKYVVHSCLSYRTLIVIVSLVSTS